MNLLFIAVHHKETHRQTGQSLTGQEGKMSLFTGSWSGSLLQKTNKQESSFGNPILKFTTALLIFILILLSGFDSSQNK